MAPSDDTQNPPSPSQATVWNGPGGEGWVAAQPTLDLMFKAIEEALVEQVRTAGARQVLDIGCGAGATTLAIARELGADARCTGLDISAPLIAAARARAEQQNASADFILADAETYTFEPDAFDMIVSRFGVMFFEDSVRAFANVHAAARPGASLCFFAWRAPQENPFMTAAEHAARTILPDLPLREPNTPGPFAFADADRLHAILQDAGWRDIAIQPRDFPCAFPVADLDRFFLHVGPVAQIMRGLDDEKLRARLVEATRRAYDPMIEDDEVRFTASCWMASAKAP